MGLRKLCAKLYVNIKIVPKDIRAERRLEPLVSAILVWLNVQIVRKDIKAERRVGHQQVTVVVIHAADQVRKDIRAERRAELPGIANLRIVPAVLPVSLVRHVRQKPEGGRDDSRKQDACGTLFKAGAETGGNGGKPMSADVRILASPFLLRYNVIM